MPTCLHRTYILPLHAGGWTVLEKLLVQVGGCLTIKQSPGPKEGWGGGGTQSGSPEEGRRQFSVTHSYFVFNILIPRPALCSHVPNCHPEATSIVLVNNDLVLYLLQVIYNLINTLKFERHAKEMYLLHQNFRLQR